MMRKGTRRALTRWTVRASSVGMAVAMLNQRFLRRCAALPRRRFRVYRHERRRGGVHPIAAGEARDAGEGGRSDMPGEGVTARPQAAPARPPRGGAHHGLRARRRLAVAALLLILGCAGARAQERSEER